MQLSLWIFTSFTGLVIAAVHGDAEASVWELLVLRYHSLAPGHQFVIMEFC
jgi:hypothetical protein